MVDSKINEVINNTSNLISLLRQEMNLLDQMKIKELPELQRQKAHVIDEIEKAKNYIVTNKIAISDEEKRLIVGLQSELEEIKAANFKKLEMAGMVHEQIMKMFRADIRDQVSNESVYSKKGIKGEELDKNLPPVSFYEEV